MRLSVICRPSAMWWGQRCWRSAGTEPRVPGVLRTLRILKPLQPTAAVLGRTPAMQVPVMRGRRTVQSAADGLTHSSTCWTWFEPQNWVFREEKDSIVWKEQCRGVKNTYTTFRHNEQNLWKKKTALLERATEFPQTGIKAVFVNVPTAAM